MDGGRPAPDAGVPETGSSCGSAVMASISQNHPLGMEHILTIQPADIMAGVAKVYDIRGNATHSHFVQVTAADFVMLQAGATLIKQVCNSLTAAGYHQVVLKCGTSPSGSAPACSGPAMCGSSMTDICP